VQEAEDARIPGLLLICPDMFTDERGFFCVTADQDSWQYASQLSGGWRQLAARSERGVIRGMHVRSGAGEAKLVRCTNGIVIDVVADLRPGSPGYRDLVTYELDGQDQFSLYIPAGCAHGWQALTNLAGMAYMVTGTYDPEEDLEIAWDDPDLSIAWPLPPHPASRRGMSLAEAVRRL
jgi:dTDP-4-dehydrorhamnose 3,5-epimerase